MPDTQRSPRAITCREWAKALEAAGVITDLDTITRISIDADPNDFVKLYIERVGDERLLNVARTLEGIEISSTPAEVGRGS